MARAAAGIMKAFSGLRHKLPVVARRMQGQLQNSKRIGISDFAVRLWRAESSMRILAAASDNEFADAALGVRLSIRILRRKSLVVMIVSADNYVRIRRIQSIPDRFHLRIIAVLFARTE